MALFRSSQHCSAHFPTKLYRNAASSSTAFAAALATTSTSTDWASVQEASGGSGGRHSLLLLRLIWRRGRRRLWRPDLEKKCAKLAVFLKFQKNTKKIPKAKSPRHERNDRLQRPQKPNHRRHCCCRRSWGLRSSCQTVAPYVQTSAGLPPPNCQEEAPPYLHVWWEEVEEGQRCVYHDCHQKGGWYYYVSVGRIRYWLQSYILNFLASITSNNHTIKNAPSHSTPATTRPLPHYPRPHTTPVTINPTNTNHHQATCMWQW